MFFISLRVIAAFILLCFYIRVSDRHISYVEIPAATQYAWNNNIVAGVISGLPSENLRSCDIITALKSQQCTSLTPYEREKLCEYIRRREELPRCILKLALLLSCPLILIKYLDKFHACFWLMVVGILAYIHYFPPYRYPAKSMTYLNDYNWRPDSLPVDNTISEPFFFYACTKYGAEIYYKKTNAGFIPCSYKESGSSEEKFKLELAAYIKHQVAAGVPLEKLRQNLAWPHKIRELTEMILTEISAQNEKPLLMQHRD